MITKFKNAREAFVYFYNEINSNGVVFGDTKALFNVGFTLEHPQQKNINVLNPNRNFNLQYAETRQAVISIYDGKEISTYLKDTPCTYAVQFNILNSKLHMAVLMRSNDLWFGFCNDQYCFASLQELVADRLSIELGTYYHFAHNLHLYNNKLK